MWLERLLTWIDGSGVPTIPYVGTAGSRIFNPPAPHIELCHMIRGQYRQLSIGDRQVCIPPDHVSLHNVHLGNHAPAPSAQTRLWCVFFDVSDEPLFERLADAPLFCAMPVRRKARITRAFEELQFACLMSGATKPSYLDGRTAYDPAQNAGGNVALRFLVKAAVLNLLATVLEEGQAAPGEEGDVMPSAVRAAIQFIGLHYADPDLALSDIAAAANLSIDHFGRLFRTQLDTTPMRYLKSVRIGQSRFLLAHTGLRIEEIARAVGFRDAFHFSRTFRNVAGMSPSQYRKRHAG